MHELRVIEKATGETVESIDVSDETATAIAQIRAGLRTQLNHDDFKLEEVREEDHTCNAIAPTSVLECPACKVEAGL